MVTKSDELKQQSEHPLPETSFNALRHHTVVFSEKERCITKYQAF